MHIRHSIKTALGSLRANKSRSALTILGIIIGITAIILVMSLGAGAQALILGEVQGIGTQTIAVVPGREPTGPSDVTSLYSDSLKQRDITALENPANVPGLKDVMPVVFGAETAVYGPNTYQVSIFGGTELLASMFDLAPKEGEFFGANDVLSRANVVVIGSKVASHLFTDGEDPVGQTIRIKGKSFRVVAVLPASGGGTLFNFDDMTLMPYTTAQDYLLGIKYFNRIIVEAKDGADVSIVADDVKLTLRESHNITDPSKDDFFVQTQADLANRLSTITSALTWFLVAMASISLIVGGVGIMNIMLVSVAERTREIGLHKAVGATAQDISRQYLLESVFLTGIGGAVGIALGFALSFLVSLVLQHFVSPGWKFVFSVPAVFLGLTVSAGVGLVFGLYPAKKAAEKSPIEALRYE